MKCWKCSEPGHFARVCNAAPKEEAADEVSQATVSVHGDGHQASDDDSTQEGEVLPAEEVSVEQHSGAIKGMTLAELRKHGRRDERRGNSPPLTRPRRGAWKDPTSGAHDEARPGAGRTEPAAGARAGKDGCWGRSPRSPTCAPSGSAWCRARGGETRRCQDACLAGGYCSTCVPPDACLAGGDRCTQSHSWCKQAWYGR